MTRKIASKAATVAVVLAAMTSVARAEPIKLADAQMDQVTAGEWVLIPYPGGWLPYQGSYLYIWPGSYWVDPNMVLYYSSPPPPLL